MGPELEGLLGKAPPPKAPAWFAARTLARLRDEQGRKEGLDAWLPRWRWLWAAGAAALVAGWVLWNQSGPPIEISDAEVFAGLEALWQQDEENRWWTGL